VSWPFTKVNILFSVDHLVEKSFQMMYSNKDLSFCWTLPLKEELWIDTTVYLFYFS